MGRGSGLATDGRESGLVSRCISVLAPARVTAVPNRACSAASGAGPASARTANATFLNGAWDDLRRDGLDLRRDGLAPRGPRKPNLTTPGSHWTRPDLRPPQRQTRARPPIILRRNETASLHEDLGKASQTQPGRLPILSEKSGLGLAQPDEQHARLPPLFARRVPERERGQSP